MIDETPLRSVVPAPGLYVVSAHAVARTAGMGPNGEGKWLRHPTAIVGHCLYIYDIK